MADALYLILTLTLLRSTYGEFESTNEAGAKCTYPMQASRLRQNDHVMLKGRPCKIVEIGSVAEEKHGHSKVTIVGVDIFTGQKYEEVVPSTHICDAPHVSRKVYPVMGVSDGVLETMDDEGRLRRDWKLPEGDLGKEIQTRVDRGDVNFLVTALSACGEEKVVGTKEYNYY
ncbi:eukaryotic translation initiation factor 5A-1-like [Branchiostoma floridae]|uniref:Eukaryotic translation initiation factor 5A n=1 Tax=Branchiostoma floridae TaxID=7739 RepID=A0A9J7LEU0_BRAFL|nr:eukaryotic translation initiation factor 5A-1-like [Branchiostoma floridae]